MNRSVETIRYTLKQFDQEHPDLAIFPTGSGPLTDEAKKKIYQQYRRGASVEPLASRHCRTKTSIYRVINEMRAQRILELPLDYIPNPGFGRLDPQIEFCTGRCRSRKWPQRRPGCRAACRRTWRACTRCRC